MFLFTAGIILRILKLQVSNTFLRDSYHPPSSIELQFPSHATFARLHLELFELPDILYSKLIYQTWYELLVRPFNFFTPRPAQDALSQAASASKAAMAALRKPEDDDPQYKEIGLEGVGAEVSGVREKTKGFHIFGENREKYWLDLF